MRYRITRNIIVDEQKLELLLRLGCNNDIIFDVICGKKDVKTGDKIIDEILESLVSKKEYKNWGGSRKSGGRKRKQVENQDENQDDAQDYPNLETKTITKTKTNNKSGIYTTKLSTTRETKKSYGEFGNVKLTPDEYDKLVETYGDDDQADFAIEVLDGYLENKPKCKYKSHYAVMRKGNWVWDKVQTDWIPTKPKVFDPEKDFVPAKPLVEVPSC